METRFKSIKPISINLELALQYSSFFNIEYIKNDLIRLYKSINYEDISTQQFTSFCKLIENYSQDIDLQELIKENWDKTILKLFSLARHEDEYTSILEIFTLYELDYSKFISQQTIFEYVQNKLIGYFTENLNDYVEASVDYNRISDFNDLHDKLDDIEYELSGFFEKFNLDLPEKFIDKDHFEDRFIKATHNQPDYEPDYYSKPKISDDKAYSPETLVDNLFEK
jgi:hypothetical protein